MTDRAVFDDPLLEEGFAQVPNAVMRTKALTLQSKALYSLMLSYAWKNKECFPAQATLAEDLNVSDRYIRILLRELQNELFLTVERKGFGQTNIYRFLNFYKTREDLFRANSPSRKPSSSMGRKRVSVRSGNMVPQKTGSRVPPNNTQEEYTKKNTGDSFKILIDQRAEKFFQNTGRPPSEAIKKLWREKLERGQSIF